MNLSPYCFNSLLNGLPISLAGEMCLEIPIKESRCTLGTDIGFTS